MSAFLLDFPVNARLRYLTYKCLDLPITCKFPFQNRLSYNYIFKRIEYHHKDNCVYQVRLKVFAC
jgi:hypothetical protein